MGCGASALQNSISSKNSPLSIKKVPPPKKSILKLLWLGSDSCGLSTLMQTFNEKFTRKITFSDRKQYLPIMTRIIIQTIKLLCRKVDRVELPLCCLREYDIIDSLELHSPLSSDDLYAIQLLWHDPLIQIEWKRFNPDELPADADYFLDKLDSISSLTNYSPENIDCQHCKVIENKCLMQTTIHNNREYQCYDGGNLFIPDIFSKDITVDNITGSYHGIVFVISLSEFNELSQDFKTTQLMATVNRLEQMYEKNDWHDLPLIVMFNKRDIFAERILLTNLKNYEDYKDYNGKESFFDMAVEYIINKVLTRLSKYTSLPVSYHITSAIDRHFDYIFTDFIDSCNGLFPR